MMIKKLTTILSIAIVSLFVLPMEAEAGRKNKHYISAGHASCGCATYKTRYVRYYDDYRYPVYGYRSVPIRHSCSTYRTRSNYNSRSNYRSKSNYRSSRKHRYSSRRSYKNYGYGHSNRRRHSNSRITFSF